MMSADDEEIEMRDEDEDNIPNATPALEEVQAPVAPVVTEEE